MYKLTRGQPSAGEGNTSTAEQRKEWPKGLHQRRNGNGEKGKTGRASPGIRWAFQLDSTLGQWGNTCWPMTQGHRRFLGQRQGKSVSWRKGSQTLQMGNSAESGITKDANTLAPPRRKLSSIQRPQMHPSLQPSALFSSYLEFPFCSHFQTQCPAPEFLPWI